MGRKEIEKALAALPDDEAYEDAETVPAVAYDLGRRDGLRHALTLLDEIEPEATIHG